MTYEMVKRNYERKLWNLQMVKNAVVKGIISKAEFEEITGTTYAISE